MHWDVVNLKFIPVDNDYIESPDNENGNLCNIWWEYLIQKLLTLYNITDFESFCFNEQQTQVIELLKDTENSKVQQNPREQFARRLLVSVQPLDMLAGSHRSLPLFVFQVYVPNFLIILSINEISFPFIALCSRQKTYKANEETNL
jgi:hypothetical protein